MTAAEVDALRNDEVVSYSAITHPPRLARRRTSAAGSSYICVSAVRSVSVASLSLT